MKIRISIYSLWILLWLAAPTQASKRLGNIEKTKELSYQFALNKNDKIAIQNSFGIIDIRRWDKNEISVKVHIQATAATEQKADDLLNGTQVIVENSSLKSFTTKHSFDKAEMAKKMKAPKKDICENSYSLETNYIIYVPDGYALQISNAFGKTFLPDLYRSEISLRDEYGTVATARLLNVKDISLSFSTASFKEINCKDWIRNDFSTITIATLQGSPKLRCNSSKFYCTLSSDIKSFDIIDSYATVKLTLPAHLDMKYSLNLSFCNFINASSMILQNFPTGDVSSEKNISVRGCSNKCLIPLNIDSRYSTITLV